MSIELVKAWRGHDPGTLLDIDSDALATSLIETGIAKAYDAKAELEQIEEQERQSKEKQEEIDRAVKAALKESAEAEVKRPQVISDVTVVKESLDDDPRAGYKSFAEFINDVRIAGSGTQPPRKLLDSQRSLQIQTKQTGLNEGVGADGGFLVPTEFKATLLQKMHDESALAQRCQQLPLTTNSIDIPYVNETSRVPGSQEGGVTAYWLKEAATKQASRPEFGKVELKLKKVVALLWATDELLQDSVITLEAMLNQMVGRVLAWAVDNAIYRGTGAGQPLGIVPAGATVTVAPEPLQPVTTVIFENIVNMWSRMWAPSRPRSIWVINQDVEPQLFNLQVTTGLTGYPAYLPAGGLSAAPYGTLMGRPVIPIEHCSTLGTIGDIALIDLNEYLLATKGGIQSDSSIHVHFVYDETCFRWVYRVDGQPWWSTPLTPATGSANTLSPFVILDGRP